ncbi:armadillo-type protein [Aspergillus keveii]|uniref:Armadillo-type protein n=1 Tax=Aspergillus keveii TaxID=714993 RepID=A0ABR4FHC5_9EURO
MGRLDDSDGHDVRRAAVEALGSQSPWPPEILQAVMGRLADSNGYVRGAAIDALGNQSPWPPEILQAVMGRLADSDWGVRSAAVEALGSQSHWPPEILQAVMGRLADSDWDVRNAAVGALGRQSPWPPEILQAVMGRLDDSIGFVRHAAVDALGNQSPWPPEILQAVMGRLDDSDWDMASRLEALLWKHDDIPSHFVQLHPDAAAATLCRIWARKSIEETFICYVRDGNIYFEMPDGRKTFVSSRKDIQRFKDRLRVATLHSPILRLVYKDGTPFSGLRY